jgi:tripartite-type tricarboxylate transporter receptor subunit TctC
MVAIVPSIFVVHPGVSAQSMAELIALARAQPGQLSYASGGNGTAQHLFGELLKQMAKLDIQHVPYRGGGPAMTDTIVGRMQILCDTLPLALPHIREGRVRAVAVTKAERHPAVPDAPTVAESGVPGYEAVGWYGIAAPAGVPGPIIERMNREVNTLVARPALKEKLSRQGADPLPMTPSEFGARIEHDRALDAADPRGRGPAGLSAPPRLGPCRDKGGSRSSAMCALRCQCGSGGLAP